MIDPLDRACRGKIGHVSPEAAALALAGHKRETGDHGVRVYKCPHCPCWHIGHPSRGERRRLQVQHVWDLIDQANAPAPVIRPVPIVPPVSAPIPDRVRAIVPAVPISPEPFLSILRRQTQRAVDAACEGWPRLMPRAVAVQKVTLLTGLAFVWQLDAVQCVEVLEFFEAAMEGRSDWQRAERKLSHQSKGRTRGFRHARREQAARDADEMEAA